MNDIELRRAEADDAAAIAAVLLEAFAEYRALYTSKGFAATTPETAEIVARLEEGPIWLALSDGGIIGTASAVLRPASLYIRGMAVLPIARGRRVGHLLLGAVEHYAIENNRRLLILSTTPFLDRAIRLYQRSGFRRTDEGPHDLFGTPLFSMEKLIAQERESAV